MQAFNGSFFLLAVKDTSAFNFTRQSKRFANDGPTVPPWDCPGTLGPFELLQSGELHRWALQCNDVSSSAD